MPWLLVTAEGWSQCVVREPSRQMSLRLGTCVACAISASHCLVDLPPVLKVCFHHGAPISSGTFWPQTLEPLGSLKGAGEMIPVPAQHLLESSSHLPTAACGLGPCCSPLTSAPQAAAARAEGLVCAARPTPESPVCALQSCKASGALVRMGWLVLAGAGDVAARPSGPASCCISLVRPEGWCFWFGDTLWSFTFPSSFP